MCRGSGVRIVKIAKPNYKPTPPYRYVGGAPGSGQIMQVTELLTRAIELLAMDYSPLIVPAYGMVIDNGDTTIICWANEEGRAMPSWTGCDVAFGELAKHRSWAEVAFFLMQRDGDLRDVVL
jgi:hypothetical protein